MNVEDHDCARMDAIALLDEIRELLNKRGLKERSLAAAQGALSPVEVMCIRERFDGRIADKIEEAQDRIRAMAWA